MDIPSFLPHRRHVKVENVIVADQDITLIARATRKRAQCPFCQRWSKRAPKRLGGGRSYFCRSWCALAPALYRWRMRPSDLRTSAGDPLSRYWRTIADQPWAGRPVAIRLRVRRFFCLNRRCPRRIFTERLPDLVDTHGWSIRTAGRYARAAEPAAALRRDRAESAHRRSRRLERFMCDVHAQ